MEPEEWCKMKDYSVYPETGTIYSGTERKYEILIDGYRYIVKVQSHSESGLLYNHVSEYLGSHIFQSVNIPVQETVLGTYRGLHAVILKSFLQEREALIPFNGISESTLEQDKELYQDSYEDIITILENNRKSTDVQETTDRFWDMFIVDALIGNFDRHGGNWDFIKKEGRYAMATVYDNSSCLYPRLNTDEQIEKVLADQAEIDKRVYTFPTSHIKHNGRKSSYFEIINSLQYEQCNLALLRIMERLDMKKIDDIVDSVPEISQLRNHFYKLMLKTRCEKILLPSYCRLCAQQRKGKIL